MAREKKGKFWIGTSGWHYDHWKGPFYPRDISSGEMLDYYIRTFRTVEINSSFYRLPSPETWSAWRESAPTGFLFSCKASRYITHMKKLKDPDAGLTRFLGSARKLGDRLGPILFQLPPRWKANPDRLRDFVGSLPSDHLYAFEFRDPTWFQDPVFHVLSDAGVAFCISQIEGVLSPREVTAGFVYIRLHGPGKAYQGKYAGDELAGWAVAMSTWARTGRDIFCYFDNDEKGYAAINARELQEMLQVTAINREDGHPGTSRP